MPNSMTAIHWVQVLIIFVYMKTKDNSKNRNEILLLKVLSVIWNKPEKN